MSDILLTRVRFQGGRYEALLDAAAPPGLEAVHQGKIIAVAELSAEEGVPNRHRVMLDLPATVLGAGVQVITLRATGSGQVLDRITLLSGDALDEDIRAELALLRDELEMLKHAFRRHCADTAGR
jgi:hypothetical protein